LSTEVEQREKEGVDWRRSKVQELSSQGYSQRDIAQILQVSNGTVNKDLSILREQAKSNIDRYNEERLPEEYEECMVGLSAILREAWNTAQQTEDKREKIQSLTLSKECYSMNLDLLTNATLVDDAIRFVSQSKSKEEVNSSSSDNEHDKEESDEPDYGEDKDQLDDNQEEETGQITATTNEVF
jgi:predicted transcriptional regulator